MWSPKWKCLWLWKTLKHCSQSFLFSLYARAGYEFDIDVTDTLLKPSVKPIFTSLSLSFSPSLSKLTETLPVEQLGVSECGWSAEGGRERISPALMFPEKRGRKGTRKREWKCVCKREKERENMLRDYICLPDVASTVVWNRKKRKFKSKGKLVLNSFLLLRITHTV